MSDRRKCRVCKQQNRVMYRCSTCKHAFCSKHIMRTGECWGCARKTDTNLQNDVMTLCTRCKMLKPINFEHSLGYMANMCKECGDNLDKEYVEYCERIMKDGEIQRQTN